MYSSKDFWILSKVALCCRNMSFLPLTVHDFRAMGSSAVAFMVAFVSIVVYAFTLSKRRREDAKNLPLDDAMPADEALSRGDGAPTDAPLLTL
mgnify:CR=1 FL=1